MQGFIAQLVLAINITINKLLKTLQDEVLPSREFKYIK